MIFARGNRYMAGAGWFLLDGILTVLLSLFLLFHQAFTTADAAPDLRNVAAVLRRQQIRQSLLS